MFTQTANTKRLSNIKNNKFFMEESNLIQQNQQLHKYYQHIIDNVDIDKSNPNNSYIMWAYDKVDVIDIDQSVIINNGHSSLPDVDMDFEKNGREQILDYVRQIYGNDHVSQMCTFTRLQGRSALKDVLRAHSTCDFETMNRITQFIPNEAEIADQLQLMKEADKQAGGDGEASIITWALEAHKKDLEEWCYIDDNGKLCGPLAKRFEQAIRIEGTIRSSSKHAAGVVISQQSLPNVCPMIYDKSSDEPIAGMSMDDLESMGHVKFDFLGIAALDKLHCIQDLLFKGNNERPMEKNNGQC